MCYSLSDWDIPPEISGRKRVDPASKESQTLAVNKDIPQYQDLELRRRREGGGSERREKEQGGGAGRERREGEKKGRREEHWFNFYLKRMTDLSIVS